MIGSRWKAVGLVVLLAEPVLAAVTPDESLVLDRWELQLGGFFTRIDTRLRLKETENRPPTEVNFEDDLGFDNADNLFRFSISRILGKRHEIRFTYFELDRDSQFTLETELDIGDETLPINTEGVGIFDTELGLVDYTYWVVAKEKTAFGLTAGLTVFDLTVGIDADAPELE
ncbi:MAG: hypothetical protein P8Y44_11500, partial [Acidobacteriota bacterium]